MCEETKQKLLFDARWIGAHGIGRFAREIARHFEVEFAALESNPVSPFDCFYLSKKLLKYKKPKWFFSAGISAPFFAAIPYVLTVHDLNHIDRPENSNSLKRLYYRSVLTWLVWRAKAVFTVSNFSKKRIIQYFSINPSKVFVIGNGVSSAFSVSGARYECDFPYILCVSNRKAHKNERRILQAFANANLPTSVKLLFTGLPADTLEQWMKELGLTDRVVFVGRQEDKALAKLYRSALFLLFTSLYEGFGLPIVEAFASGIPVITSNVTSMPEIAGGAALLVNPYAVDEIKEAIEKLYHSKTLRLSLRSKGLQIAGQYTWESVAHRMANALDDLDLSYIRKKL